GRALLRDGASLRITTAIDVVPSPAQSVGLSEAISVLVSPDIHSSDPAPRVAAPLARLVLRCEKCLTHRRNRRRFFEGCRVQLPDYAWPSFCASLLSRANPSPGEPNLTCE